MAASYSRPRKLAALVATLATASLVAATGCQINGRTICPPGQVAIAANHCVKQSPR